MRYPNLVGEKIATVNVLLASPHHELQPLVNISHSIDSSVEVLLIFLNLTCWNICKDFILGHITSAAFPTYIYIFFFFSLETLQVSFG